MEQAVAKLGAEVVDRILAAAMADPDAMRQFANDISPPAEPVQDYLTEVDTRRTLFDELRAICQHHNIMPNATIFAVFMVAPVSEIRTFFDCIRRESGLADIAHDFAKPAPSALLNEPGMPVPSSSVTRNGFSDKVKDRDRHVCVFSGMSDPQAAHIFPFATSEKKDFANLNHLLTTFWGSEKAMAWRRNFEAAGITQSAKNGISMNHQIHFWFDNARFALKPLRETPEGIVVQWHWLKRSVLKPNVYIRPNIDILHQAGVIDRRWGDTLAHRESGVLIQTGQTFILQRHEHMPSWELLEMQWNLLRVAALCGAADVMDEYYDFEDPDERGYDEAVTAKQRAILAEYEKAKGKAEVVDQAKGKGLDREDAGDEDTRE
ncbi:hypothetical protein MMYC01_204672 [Madurella mycetomatis]|uniref:HNH nuclease domain-containing protein n=1 Tax=Madurella mycetomatis TaxID=100816 RepID=A0A175W9Y5_9PEZI|nr:hypothetical protein MMYC01_204672 [Madurella mycetomatis]